LIFIALNKASYCRACKNDWFSLVSYFNLVIKYIFWF